jgi:hypothetical protein
MEPNKHVYGSECCAAELVPHKETVVKTLPGVTSYFRNTCAKCGKLTHSKLLQVFDSNGIEIKAGDIVECPDLPVGHAERYHAAFDNGWGFEIRDLGNNNVHMYDLAGPYYNIGHYTKHLDKLTDDDLEYYFDTTRGEASKERDGR